MPSGPRSWAARLTHRGWARRSGNPTGLNRPLIAVGDDADGNTIADLWAITGDGKLLFYSGARDASGNPTNGASPVVGSSGWNAITVIS